jgi:enoyl-CoA hydratase
MPPVQSGSEVRIERSDGLAVLVLDAPQRRNALTAAMGREITAACDEIDADASIGAVIVRGEGGYFCAGGDRPTLAKAGADPAHPEQFEAMDAIYGAFARVGQLEPPTVAAVEGGAVGAGLNLMLATDLRIVARDARITSGFLGLGLHPGGGHGTLLARTGSRETGAALALFGATIDGTAAAQAGLAYAAVAPDEVVDRAVALTAAPAADPDLSRRTARSFRLQAGPPTLPWPAALELERPAQMWSMRRRAG